ncbi:MAG: hypothetical protein JXA73_07775 [Acidobacteria bacterium]|nr:hypothetical protein [Acidobacteriota bacterium]
MKRSPTSPRIKQHHGWIAAGDEFRSASRLLSDGAFKLFVRLSLEADSRTGRVYATYKQLAAELRKSKRAIVTYAAELSAENVCEIRLANNQYRQRIFEIGDSFWPYERETSSSFGAPDSYVTEVQRLYLSLGCTWAKLGAADVRKAQEFKQRSVPLEIVQNALLLGACRKYSSWLDGNDSAPNGSLAYFENLVAEIQQQPLPQGYKDYLRMQHRKLAKTWAQKSRSQSGILK